MIEFKTNELKNSLMQIAAVEDVGKQVWGTICFVALDQNAF